MYPDRRDYLSGPKLPSILLGPGGTFCIDYNNPQKLLAGPNLPPGLKASIAYFVNDSKTPSDWDADLYADADLSPDNDSSKDDDSGSRSRSRRRRGTDSDADARAGESPVIVRRDARDYHDDYPVRGRDRRDERPTEVTNLAFGSRLGDYVAIVRLRGHCYLGTPLALVPRLMY
jgi:hypothetical protein